MRNRPAPRTALPACCCAPGACSDRCSYCFPASGGLYNCPTIEVLA